MRKDQITIVLDHDTVHTIDILGNAAQTSRSAMVSTLLRRALRKTLTSAERLALDKYHAEMRKEDLS